MQYKQWAGGNQIKHCKNEASLMRNEQGPKTRADSPFPRRAGMLFFVPASPLAVVLSSSSAKVKNEAVNQLERDVEGAPFPLFSSPFILCFSIVGLVVFAFLLFSMPKDPFPSSARSALPAISCIAALASSTLASGPEGDLQRSLSWPSIKCCRSRQA